MMVKVIKVGNESAIEGGCVVDCTGCSGGDGGLGGGMGITIEDGCDVHGTGGSGGDVDRSGSGIDVMNNVDAGLTIDISNY